MSSLYWRIIFLATFSQDDLSREMAVVLRPPTTAKSVLKLCIFMHSCTEDVSEIIAPGLKEHQKSSTVIPLQS